MNEEQKLFAEIATQILVARLRTGEGLSQNHEAGLIPMATRILLTKIADSAPGQPATEGPDAVQEAVKPLDQRIRDFLHEFAEHRFEEVRNFSGSSPEDELEATTEHAPVIAFQEDAQSLLETAFPKRCKGGDIDAFNGDCMWCGAPMGGTCQDAALRDLEGGEG